MYRRILLTDDGSPLARDAVTQAAGMAAPMHAAVIVIRVSHSTGMRTEDLTADSWFALLAQTSATLGEADPPLREVAAALRDSGVGEAGCLLVHADDPGRAIVDAARRLGCDLIVMSTHGLSGLRRSMLGSISQFVVQHSPVPVLLCR